MPANDKQISGEHYKAPIQCWDFIASNKLDFFQGCIVKYVTRFRTKGGRRDLEKAIHFLEKLIELDYGPEFPMVGQIIPCNDPKNITNKEVRDWLKRFNAT